MLYITVIGRTKIKITYENQQNQPNIEKKTKFKPKKSNRLEYQAKFTLIATRSTIQNSRKLVLQVNMHILKFEDIEFQECITNVKFHIWYNAHTLFS